MNPTKEQTYLPSRYPPFGLIFCAVPVLPATINPGTAAPVAVPPFRTTSFSAATTFFEVASDMTRRTIWGRKAAIGRPSGSVTWEMMSGFTRLPPLATADIAVIIWMGVTAIDWPIGMRVISILLQRWGGFT